MMNFQVLMESGKMNRFDSGVLPHKQYYFAPIFLLLFSKAYKQNYNLEKETELPTQYFPPLSMNVIRVGESLLQNTSLCSILILVLRVFRTKNLGSVYS